MAALPGRGIGTQARTRLWSTGLSGRLGSAAPSSSHVPGVSWRPAQRGHVVAGVRVSGSRWRGVGVVGQGRRREGPRKAEARRHGRSKVSNGPVQAGGAGRSFSSGFHLFFARGGAGRRELLLASPRPARLRFLGGSWGSPPSEFERTPRSKGTATPSVAGGWLLSAAAGAAQVLRRSASLSGSGGLGVSRWLPCAGSGLCLAWGSLGRSWLSGCLSPGRELSQVRPGPRPHRVGACPAAARSSSSSTSACTTTRKMELGACSSSSESSVSEAGSE